MLSAITLLSLALVSFAANPYATYPSVAKTASINGFADPIYGQVPECAKECLKQDTGVTPCPYWDPGCLCVMPTFAGPVADCIAKSCKGDQVQLATDLAVGLCNSVGANTWMIPASLVTALAEARKDAEVATTTSADQSKASSLALPATLTSAESTTATSSSTGSTKAAVSTTSAPSASTKESSTQTASGGASSASTAASASTTASASSASSIASASTFQGLAAAHAVPVVALAIAMII